MIVERKLIKIKLADLQFDPDNPNEMSAEQMAGLRESMQRFGYLTPIIIDQNNKICDGEHRALVYKEFGVNEIPAFRVEMADDSERRLLRQVMNKLHGVHDKQRDANELYVLLQNNKLDELAILIAKPKTDFQQILSRTHGIEFYKEDETPELDSGPAITKPGDIWELGRHRLLCGDANKDLDTLLHGVKPSILLTDPPYGMNLDTDWTSAKTRLSFLQTKGAPRHGNKYDPVIGDADDYDPTPILQRFHDCKEIFMFGADYYAERLPKGGSWLVWDKRLEESFDQGYGSAFELLWSKNKHKREIIRVRWFGIYGTETQDIKQRVHPTQKPIQLFAWLINRFSKQGDIILDPYLGSGSTLIACEQTGRTCYSMEIDPKYCDVIIKRWENLTGQKAKRLVIRQGRNSSHN